jgi:Rrf2 family protein
MRLTKAADYAIRCILYMAERGDKAFCQRTEISEAMDIPSHFLAKVVQKLAREGIIRITRGAAGGYQLLRPASEISLLHVIEAIEGRIFLSDCLLGDAVCERDRVCPVRNIWVDVSGGLRQKLNDITFDTIVANSHRN